jgi:hypothetical protein
MQLRVALCDAGNNPCTQTESQLSLNILAVSSDPLPVSKHFSVSFQTERTPHSHYLVLSCGSLRDIIPPQFNVAFAKLAVCIVEAPTRAATQPTPKQLKGGLIELDTAVLKDVTMSPANVRLAFVEPIAEVVVAGETGVGCVMTIGKEYAIRLRLIEEGDGSVGRRGVVDGALEVIVQLTPHLRTDRSGEQKLCVRNDSVVPASAPHPKLKNCINAPSVLRELARSVPTDKGLFEAVLVAEVGGYYELQVLVRNKQSSTLATTAPSQKGEHVSCTSSVMVVPAAVLEIQATRRLSVSTTIPTSGFVVSWRRGLRTSGGGDGARGMVNAGVQSSSTWELAPVAHDVQVVDGEYTALGLTTSPDTSCLGYDDEWERLAVVFDTTYDQRLGELMDHVDGLRISTWANSSVPVVPLAKMLASVLSEFVWSLQNQSHSQHQRRVSSCIQNTDVHLNTGDMNTITISTASSLLAECCAPNIPESALGPDCGGVAVGSVTKAVVFKLMCQRAGIPCRLHVQAHNATSLAPQRVFVYVSEKRNAAVAFASSIREHADEYEIDLDTPMHPCTLIQS